MNLFFIQISLALCITANIISLDPDVSICMDPALDGAVFADDGITYIFKDQYFWETKSLVKETGIKGFAKLISSRWPAITDRIRVVFTLPKNKRQVITIFVVKNKWFAYEADTKISEGSTDYWPDFNNMEITVAFPSGVGNPTIYFLHSKNQYYMLYNFKNMTHPIKVRSGLTSVRIPFIWFFESELPPGRAAVQKDIKNRGALEAPLTDIIDPRAGVTYLNRIVLIAKDVYCIVKMDSMAFEKECSTSRLITVQLLKCPLDIKSRPTTIAPMITTASIQGLTPKDDEAVIGNPILDDSIVTFGPFDPLDTSISSRIVTDVGAHSTGTDKKTQLMEAQIYEKNEKNSEFWGFALIIGFVVIAVSAILGVGFVSRVKGKRPKGRVTYIK